MAESLITAFERIHGYRQTRFKFCPVSCVREPTYTLTINDDTLMFSFRKSSDENIKMPVASLVDMRTGETGTFSGMRWGWGHVIETRFTRLSLQADFDLSKVLKAVREVLGWIPLGRAFPERLKMHRILSGGPSWDVNRKGEMLTIEKGQVGCVTTGEFAELANVINISVEDLKTWRYESDDYVVNNPAKGQT